MLSISFRRIACGILFSLIHAAAAALPLPWLENGQEQARLALRLLRDAASHGLDPARYDADALTRRLSELEMREDSAGATAFERDLGAAMGRYLADLHAGRTASPYHPASGAAAGFDPALQLRLALDAKRLAQAVDQAAPAIPLYARVRTTLAQYRELARLYPEWPSLPPAGQAGVAAGSAYPGSALLRERLQLLGDLGEDDAPAGEQIYTAELAAAVRRFQSRHGLVEDGVLGPGTLAALSVPLTHRVAQLALTLERLRWMPPPPDGRLVAVNLPAYRLWAFDLGSRSWTAPLEMRVIVGKAARTPTPLFIGQMRYLEFNPYWNVPRSIELGEIIPKLARNPAYLEQHDMELVGAGGQVLPSTGGEALARLRAGTARTRQRPGPSNVLGEVKFAMPNPMNIYLHSTSSKELFARTRRDLSHGCIRVERPAELAQFVLADPEQWSAERVADAMRPGPSRTVRLRAPVPVVLFYATALADRDGRALFADDIYGLDQPLIRALRAD